MMYQQTVFVFHLTTKIINWLFFFFISSIFIKHKIHCASNKKWKFCLHTSYVFNKISLKLKKKKKKKKKINNNRGYAPLNVEKQE